MSKVVDLYDNVYGDYESHAEAAVRHETYGEDIGQSSWMTATDESCRLAALSCLCAAPFGRAPALAVLLPRREGRLAGRGYERTGLWRRRRLLGLIGNVPRRLSAIAVVRRPV
jgi:hypothetical protein